MHIIPIVKYIFAFLVSLCFSINKPQKYVGTNINKNLIIFSGNDPSYNKNTRLDINKITHCIFLGTIKYIQIVIIQNSAKTKDVRLIVKFPRIICL